MAELAHITGIVASNRDGRRVVVKVDGKATARLSIEQVAALGLAAGMAWDAALAGRVAEAAAYDKAMQDALRRLNRRAMSRGDLDRKLRQLEHEPAIRQRVLERLAELSLLDDEAFGRALIRETTARRAAGPRLLGQKLRRKGLDRQLIDRLLAELREGQGADPAAGAIELARKRLASMQRLDAATRKRRLYGLLSRRGFEPPVIDTVMRTLADELGKGDEDDYPSI